MRRPFSILCLSDLHLRHEDDVSVYFRELKKFIFEAAKNKSVNFIPDFIVCAGDICDMGNTDILYDFQDKLIKFSNEVIYGQSANSNHRKIIVSMGNHDASFYNIDPTILQSFLEKFEQCSTIDIPVYDSFAEFCRCVFGKLEEGDLYSGIQNIGEVDRKPLNCLRIFKEEKVCFWTINTELVSFSEQQNKSWLDNKEGRLKYRENGFVLQSDIIKDEMRMIHDVYNDYFVVTVMHRPIFSMNWAQKQNPEIFDRIISMSDIIISGHEHNKVVKEPTFILNQAQSFEIGKGSEYYASALLVVDPIQLNVRMHSINFQKCLEGTFKCSSTFCGEFPLKKGGNGMNRICTVDSNCLHVLSKSANEKDICLAIMRYMDLHYDNDKIVDAYENLCVLLEYKPWEPIDEGVVNGIKRIIFYHIGNLSLSERCLPKGKPLLDKILRQEIIVDHIVVDINDVVGECADLHRNRRL